MMMSLSVPLKVQIQLGEFADIFLEGGYNGKFYPLFEIKANCIWILVTLS